MTLVKASKKLIEFDTKRFYLVHHRLLLNRAGMGHIAAECLRQKNQQIFYHRARWRPASCCYSAKLSKSICLWNIATGRSAARLGTPTILVSVFPDLRAEEIATIGKIVAGGSASLMN